MTKSEQKVSKGFFITPMGKRDSETDKNSRKLMSIINESLHSENLSAKLSRTDQLHHTGVILDNILLEIRKADFIVADLTNQNPNIYYELGFAIGAGKKLRTICICQEDNFDIASDIGGYYTIGYNLNSENLQLDFTNQFIKAFKELNFDPDLHSVAGLNYKIVDNKSNED